MKNTKVLKTLAYISLPLIVFMSNISTANPNVSPDGHYRTETGEIVMNLKACQSIPCELQFQYLRVRVVGGDIHKYYGQITGVYSTASSPLRILSNLPISRIALNSNGNSDVTKVEKNGRKAQVTYCADSGNRYWFNVGSRQDSIQDLEFTKNQQYGDCGRYYITASEISFNVGSAIAIAEDMKNGSIPLISAYTGISEHLADFRQIVAKDSSDARHLSRLEAQIKSLLKAMVDEKGDALLPVTHRRVTEGSRMIMVLSTVLEEIMDKYDFNSRFLEPLKPAKEALSQLSRQIRSAYGWEEGLAGSGSKALASLSSVLDTELRNMYSLVAAFNSDPQIAQTFNALFRANSTLFARVSASNAGDVAGTNAAREVLNQWNSAQFQSVLTTMMNAPKESQASLQNRILMALTAIESIKDYVDPKGDSNTRVDVPAQVRAKLP